MTIRLHPEMLAAAYEFLNETDPFSKWGLPSSEDVKFRVLKTTRWHADCFKKRDAFCIRVSQATHSHTMTLFGSIAHEMVHIRQMILKDKATHNALFARLAKEVCQHHGFDIRAF